MWLREIAKMYDVDEKDLLRRADGRIEWVCEHGVGHTVWFPKGSTATHGCDGCCRKLKPKEIADNRVEKVFGPLTTEAVKKWGRSLVDERIDRIREIQSSIHDKSLKTTMRINEQLVELEKEIDLLNKVFGIAEFRLSKRKVKG